jgi:hypothetical protein
VVVSSGLDAVGTTRASACSGLRPRCPAAGFTVYSALGCGVGAARRFKPGFRRGCRKRHAKARVVPFGLMRAKDLPTTFSYTQVRKNQFPLKK